MKTLLFLFLLTSLLACEKLSPISKSDYFRRFELFVTHVETHGHSFNSADWSRADAYYIRYSDEWYHTLNRNFTEHDQRLYRDKCMRYHTKKIKSTCSRVSKKIEKWILDLENSIFD